MSMHALAGLLTATLVAAGALLVPASVAADVLDEHAWRHRLLLVFAPSLDDPRQRALQQRLDQQRCGLAERDMVVLRILPSGQDPGGDVSAAASRDLRALHAVPDDAFVVLLIGKDTGVKQRIGEVPDLARIFDRIDAMPMRRDELRRRGSRC